MKLKNVVVGSDIEAKHDTGFFTEGEVVKVLYKEDVDCKDIFTLKLENSRGGKLWSHHKYFRKLRPKKLDQSIFDGVDSKYSYFAIDKDGSGGFYDQKPELCGDYFTSGHGWHKVGQYDASNWKSSLIERDIAKELTGNDLCKAMLARGDKVVMCAVSDDGEFLDGVFDAIRGFNDNSSFESHCTFWRYVSPINNQGEPLTAKDVGL